MRPTTASRRRSEGPIGVELIGEDTATGVITVLDEERARNSGMDVEIAQRRPGPSSGHARPLQRGGALSPPPSRSRRRGRPRLYGTKTKLKHWFRLKARFQTALSPVYDDRQVTLRYY